jgi:RNase P subunit RPR2
MTIKNLCELGTHDFEIVVWTQTSVKRWKIDYIGKIKRRVCKKCWFSNTIII